MRHERNEQFLEEVYQMESAFPRDRCTGAHAARWVPITQKIGHFLPKGWPHVCPLPECLVLRLVWWRSGRREDSLAAETTQAGTLHQELVRALLICGMLLEQR